MTKAWADVAASPQFQGLAPADQEAARQQYFQQVVAPQVPSDQVDAARAQFDGATRIAPAAAAPAPTPAPAPSLSDTITSGIKSAAGAVSDAANFVGGAAKYYGGKLVGDIAGEIPKMVGFSEAPDAAPPVSKLDAVPQDTSAPKFPDNQPFTLYDSEKSPARLASEQVAATAPVATAPPEGQAAARRAAYAAPQGTLAASFHKFLGNSENTTANLTSTLGDVLGSDDLQDKAKRYHAIANETINNAMHGNEDSMAVKTLAGVYSLAPLLTGNASGISSMVSQAGIDGYGDARAAGEEPSEAISRGTAMALASYVGLRVQVPGITKALSAAVSKAPAGEAVAALGHALTTNVGGMEATTVLSDLYDKMAPGGLRPNMTAGDMVNDIAETAKSAALLTLAVPGVPMSAAHLYGAAHALAHGKGDVAARDLTAPAPAVGAPAAMLRDAGAPPIGLDTLHDSIDEVAGKVGLSPQAAAALRDAAAQKDPQDAPGFIARAFHRFEANGLTKRAGAPGAFRDALAQRLADQQPDEPAAPPATAPAAGPSVADQLAAVRPPADQPAADSAAPDAAAPDATVDPAAPAPITPEAMAKANEIADAAHQAATSPFNETPQPTDAQKAAGNYTMGHVQLHGLDVTIENPQGSVRSGVDADGKPWSNEMAAHYGYIKGTHASDGDHVDTFIGPNPESKTAFVIDQVDPNTGKFDEPKTILGTDSEEQARQLYAANYADGWNGLGAITALPMDAFKSWVRDGIKSKPLGDISEWKPNERAQSDVAEPAGATPGAGDGGSDPALAGGGDQRSPADVTGRPGGDAAAPERSAVAPDAVGAGGASDTALTPAPRLLGKPVTDHTDAALQKIVVAKSTSQRARDVAGAEIERRAAAAPAPAPIPTGRAAPSGAAKHPATVQGSRLLSLVSKNLGGLDPAWLGEFSSKQETNRIGADGRPITQWKNPLIPGVGKLFRRGGTQDLESIANMLEEHHYLPPGTVERDAHAAGQQAQDIIRAALNRVEAKTIDEQQSEDEANRNAEADAHYAALDAASAREAESERQAMFEAHNIDPSAFDRLMTDEDVAHGVPDISDHQALADFLGLTPEELEHERNTQEAQGLAGEDRAGAQAGGDAAGAARPADEAGGAAARPAGEGQPEGLTLSAQTPADLKAKTTREGVARAADAAEQKRLADRARADAQRGDFKLTGSDRPADEAAANGQAPLLSQHTEPFYSHLERSLTGLNMKAGDAGAWRQALKGLQGKGVKAEEIAWSGLDDWLKLQPGKVSKQDVLDYLARNGVKVTETEHGDLTPESRDDLAFHQKNVKFAHDKERAAIDEALDHMRKGGASQLEIMNANMAFMQDRPGDNSPQLHRAYELLRRGAPEGYDSNKINDAQDELESAMQHERRAQDGARRTGKYEQYTLPGGKNYRELLLALPPRKAEEYTRANVDPIPESDPVASNPDLFWYFKTPDQTFQIPKSRFRDQVDARDYIIREKQPDLPADKNFSSSHWDEPNVLAHVRFNDRTDAEGKKVLFIEEMQSDWGQAGKKRGFRADQEAELNRLVAQRDSAPDDAASEAIQRKIDRLGMQDPGVPSGPFVGKTDAWLSLAIKRMAKYAVDHGYDRVAFTNGEQNAERYDLSKKIARIELHDNQSGGIGRPSMDGPFHRGNVRAYDHNGSRVVDRYVSSPADLEDTIGKEAASKLLDRPPIEARSAGIGVRERSLEGLDLKVGGEGMKTFYDKIVPTVAKDVVRKLGGDGIVPIRMHEAAGKFSVDPGPGEAVRHFDTRAEAEEFAKSQGEGPDFVIDQSKRAARYVGEQPGFDITDKMRATAADGVPLFKQSGDKAPTRGVDPVALRSEVGRIQAGWKDAPPVHVVDDVNGLPGHIQDSLRSMGAEGKTRALLMPGRGSDPGDVYLIANRLRDVPMAQFALFHEVLGHFGIRKVLGSDATYFAEMYKLRQANPALAKEAEAWWQAHGKGAMAARLERGMSPEAAMKVVRALSTEEALADRAGRGEPIRGLQNLMAKVQQWLRSVGLHSVADRLESMTQAETAALLAKARSTVEAKEPSTYHGDEFAPALSEGDTPMLSQHATDDEPAETAPAGTKVAAAMAKVREAGAKIADTARQVRDDALLKTVPMALGTPETRHIAKDFANADRLARWQWGKFDDILKKNYDEAQRKEMWEAADEENVLRQQDKTPGAGQGLNRLSPDQRQTMDTLHNYGEELLQRAKDVGMFQGEGLPYWTPRMAVMIGDTGEYQRPKGAGAETGAAQGRNIVTSASSLKERKHLTAADTEAAMKGKLGDGAQLVRDIRTMPLAMARLERAIAGRDLVNNIKAMGDRSGLETVSTTEQPGFFTVDHPAFKTWQVTTGEDGAKTWEARPLYVNKAFQGPLKAVMSETPGPIYSALMSLKAKSMGLIMYSPLIHNAVEWGRALPAMPGKVATFQIYFEGNRIKNDPAQMHQAIKDGLVPIGRRGGIQDITGIMEDPTLKPGRSWTAKLIGGALGLANEKAGTVAKKGIDAAGDFWHNTLLWDRVGDLQAGLYGALRDKEIEKGMDPAAAGKVAAHFANRFAGALPNEAMSAGARKVANILMFSRTFTLGNMGLMKDMVGGLPRDIQAQIRASSGELVAAAATSRARRIAIASFILDAGLMYVGNSLMQDAVKKLRGEKSWGDIGQGYLDRLHKLMARTGDKPLETLSNPFDMANSISSTSENEPGKEDRVRVGTQDDGTAIYMRLPTGKVGEDFKNWITKPLITAKAKESQLVRPLQAVWANDNGIGQRIYDPDAKGLGGVLTNAGRIAKLFATQMVPTDAIQGALDWKNGKASDVDKLKVAGPLAGLTFSKGAPGGPEVGAMYDADRKFLGAKMDVMPSVKQAIKDGNDDKAIELMQGIKMTPPEILSVLRRLKMPESRMSAGSFRNFSKHASDEDMQRMQDLLQGEQAAKASRAAASAP